MEICRMCTYELPTSRLSKVNVTDVTLTTIIVYHAALWVVKNYEKTMSQTVADYSIGTVGTCLGPGIPRGPVLAEARVGDQIDRSDHEA